MSTSGSMIIGSELNLTCAVFELFSGLTQSPMATWTTTTSIPGSIETTTTTDRTVAVLNINPLRASHPVTYTCQGSIFTTVGSRTQVIHETIILRPQSKQPFKYATEYFIGYLHFVVFYVDFFV